MSKELVPTQQTDIEAIGQLANQYAAQNAFTDYQERMAKNTLRRHRADLDLFSQYLALAGIGISGDDLYSHPESWEHITHGLVAGYVRWQLQQGYAIGSINVHLSTIKTYCDLATSAGTLSTENLALIKLVKGYRHGEAMNVDATRETARIGKKKANTVIIEAKQAQQLKKQPDTPQGRRDALLICLLLDHGLRCGEIADLLCTSINKENGTLTFYRKKVHKTQKHELTRDTWIAAQRYFDVAKPQKYLLMGSRKGGILEARMSERAITARMMYLCQAVGIVGASAHDGRHAWATFAVAGGTDLKTLQDAGGWKSIAMPARYAESNKIANKGVKLITSEIKE